MKMISLDDLRWKLCSDVLLFEYVLHCKEFLQELPPVQLDNKQPSQVEASKISPSIKLMTRDHLDLLKLTALQKLRAEFKDLTVR